MSLQPPFKPAEIRRIAIFRALYLGDLLLSVPAFRALRKEFPEAEITLIGLPWAAEFAVHFRHYLDRFEAFPGYPALQETSVSEETSSEFISSQRGRKCDLAIQMHGDGSVSNELVRSLGARYTAGTALEPDRSPLSLPLQYREDDHEILRNLDIAQLVGCRELDPSLEFPLFAEDRREASRCLRSTPEGTPLAVLHAGAKSPERRWPAKSFAEVGRRMHDHLDAAVVLTGTTKERELTESIASQLPFAVLDLAGRTTLGGVAAIFSRADVVISNDTGPAHLAEAVGTPVVGLYRRELVSRWAPLERDRFPVFTPTPSDGHTGDLGSIRVDEVYQAAKGIVRTQGPQDSKRALSTSSGRAESTLSSTVRAQ
jgi:ADP-heptose:LPS heptosyltransferase